MATNSTFGLRRLIQARLLGHEVDANGEPIQQHFNKSNTHVDNKDAASDIRPESSLDQNGASNPDARPIPDCPSSFFDHDDEEDKAPIKRRLEGWLAIKLKLSSDDSLTTNNSHTEIPRGPSPVPPPKSPTTQRVAEAAPIQKTPVEEVKLNRRRSVSATLRRMSRESLSYKSRRDSSDASSNHSKRMSFDSSSPRSRGVSMEDLSIRSSYRPGDSPTSVRRPKSFLPPMTTTFVSETDLRSRPSELNSPLMEASDESTDDRRKRPNSKDGPKKVEAGIDGEQGDDESSDVEAKPSRRSSTKGPRHNARSSGDWSDNVKQLIKETDLAFMSVGESLGDVHSSLDLASSLDTTSPKLDLELSYAKQKALPSMLDVGEPIRGRDQTIQKSKEKKREDRSSDPPPTRQRPHDPDADAKVQRRRSRSVPPLSQFRPPPPKIMLPNERRPSEAVGPMNERRPSEAVGPKNERLPPPTPAKTLDVKRPDNARKVSDPPKNGGVLTSSELIKRSKSMIPSDVLPPPKDWKVADKAGDCRKASVARRASEAQPSRKASDARKTSVARRPSELKTGRHAKSSKSHKKGKESKTSRWGLSEGVTDILTGQRFKKIEVDEMLTPERLEQLKKEREEEKRRNKSLPSVPKTFEEMDLVQEHPNEKRSSHDSKKSNRSRGNTASSEASQDARSQARTSQSSDEASLIRKMSEKAVENVNIDKKSSLKSEDESDKKDSNEADDEMEGLKTVDLLDPSPFDDDDDDDWLPPLPPRSPAAPPPTKGLPALPSRRQSKQSASMRNSLLPVETEEYIYFKSTPYSLTTPGFRHGLISFAKSEIGKGARTMDDTLDWTAFQMAILGGADYFTNDNCDEEDSKYADEIKKWFATFSYDGCGNLIPEDFPSPRTSSTLSTAGSSDGELPIPVDAETSGLFWSGYDESTLNGGDDANNTQQTDEYRRKSSARKLSAPLVVGDDGDVDAKDIDDDESDHVSMGFNLHDDLGDFLKWEAEHAYVGGYYGAH